LEEFNSKWFKFTFLERVELRWHFESYFNRAKTIWMVNIFSSFLNKREILKVFKITVSPDFFIIEF
jgi:hypothetical protein